MGQPSRSVGPLRAFLTSQTTRDAAFAVLISRVVVGASAAVAAATLRFSNGAWVPHGSGKVVPGISHPFGGWPASGALDALFTPLVRWDALWYLTIARHGYQPEGLVAHNPGSRAAFFPLYPVLTWLFGGFASGGGAVLAASAVSLVAFFAGLWLTHRLTALELGDNYALPAILLLALAPMAYFFSAPYTESLFLALTAGAFYAARTGRWAMAGVLTMLASGTRNIGVLLLVPLLILYFYGPRTDQAASPPRTGWARMRPVYEVKPDVLWLALAPVGLAVFSGYLEATLGDALAWRSTQRAFNRQELTIPLETVRQALAAAWGAVHHPTKGESIAILYDLAALPLIALGAAGVFRRLPAAYGAWVVIAILPPLCLPGGGEPLRSVPRYAMVLFPLFMWAGQAVERRRLTRPAVAVSAVLLVALTCGFAVWEPFV